MTRSALSFAIIVISAGSIASAQECSNADFQGRYAFFGENSILGGHVGNFAAGTVYADGSGQITEWKDTFVFVHPGTGEKVVLPRDNVASAEGPVTYEVLPDCRIAIRWVSTLRPPQDNVVEFHGGLAAGGREVFGTLVGLQELTSGAQFKSMEPEAGPALTAIKDLLNRVAVRTGLRP